MFRLPAPFPVIYTYIIYMIDTHTHLDGDEFADDFEQVLGRAQAAGVEKMFLPNVNEATWPRICRLCQEHPKVLYPMIGLHPEDVNPTVRNVAQVLDDMETQLQSGVPVIGIGEVGLDFYWDETYRREQIECFERQVGWAARYDLPLMIHARNAHRELVDIIARHAGKGLRGVFHCFTGTAEEARDLLAFDGFLLGIGGVLTFKKSKLPEVLTTAVPLSRIVLETDSPYMAPVPHRGQRNESAYVVEVAKKLADIYGVTLQEVNRATTDNVLSVFHLD